MPVRLEGEVVAVINLESDRLDAFDEGDVVAVDGIAAQVASAIRNARLFEEKVRALRSLEILQEITNVLNSDLDLDALIGRIARRSVEAVRAAQMGAVLLFHEDGLRRARRASATRTPRRWRRVRLGFHEGLPGSVFVSGQGRLVRCAPEDYAGHAGRLPRRPRAASPARAPCACRSSLPQEKLGVLLLESAAGPDAFEPGDLRFAPTLAHQAAIAIGNALRMQRIVEMDRQRQDFLSNVSHELRSPLTVIQGYVEALGQEAPSAAAQQYVRDRARALRPAGPDDRRGARPGAPGEGRRPAADRLERRPARRLPAHGAEGAARGGGGQGRDARGAHRGGAARCPATSGCCASCCTTWSRTR